MNLWTMIIYGVAAVLALQGLFTLMTAHRRQSLGRFFEEELRRREELAAQPPEPKAEESRLKSKAA